MIRAVFASALVCGLVPAVTCLSAEDDKAEQKEAVVKVGDMAPDFQLKGSDGKTYKLSDFRGKQGVVVAWYPKAFTGG